MGIAIVGQEARALKFHDHGNVVFSSRVVVGLATRKLMQSHIGVTADCVFRKARLSALKLWIWI